MNHDDSIDELRDIAKSEDLSIGARGVLLYQYFQPKPWKVDFEYLQKRLGLRRLRRIFQELHKYGYAYRPRVQNGRPWRVCFTPFAYKNGKHRDKSTVTKRHPLSCLHKVNTPGRHKAAARESSFNLDDSSPTSKLADNHAQFNVKQHWADPKSLGKRTLHRWECSLRRLCENLKIKIEEVHKIHQWWMDHFDMRDEYKFMPRDNMMTMREFCRRFVKLRASYLRYQEEDNEGNGSAPEEEIVRIRKFKPSKEVE